ncbi:shikimate dehydrogenase [Microbacterium sp. NPDC055357]
MLNAPRRLAVWGDPVSQSRSPQLHAAAYAELGRDWSYGRQQVDAASFDSTLAALDSTWHGLSVTYPLKGAAFAASVVRDARAEATGAVNTLLLTSDGPHGFNTDIGGLVGALREEGISAVTHGRIVGAGATATSALVALAELGATSVDVVARRPDAVQPLVGLGERLAVTVRPAAFDAPSHAHADVTIATLPGEAVLDADAADRLASAGGLLLDVVYGHWPTDLAAAWERAGTPAISGLGMLLHQALLQVRIFVAGDPETPLAGESDVLAAMRRAVVGD